MECFSRNCIRNCGCNGSGWRWCTRSLPSAIPQSKPNDGTGHQSAFFIPTAIISLIIHNKNHLIKWKLALPMILAGLIGVGIGTLLLGKINPALLQKLFAVFLFFFGIKELFWHKKSSTPSK